MKYFERIGIVLLVTLAIVISIVFAYTATQRVLTTLESMVWQIFIFSACFVGSFFFGRQSARNTARELLKPHARNAARYLISLYKSITRAAVIIEPSRNFESYADYQIVRAYLIAIFSEQLATADDALENWRAILKSEFNDLIQSPHGDTITSEELENLIQELLPENIQKEK